MTTRKTKKVSIKPKTTNNQSDDVENWVASTETELVANSSAIAETSKSKPKMKRLTIDVTEDLHRAIKLKAVEQGTPMADMLRSLLERNYL